MKGKRIFYCELSYFLGVVILALGNTFMERASFGLSMVVAPAYLLHLKISEFLPFFSFGMAGYTLQVFLLIGLSIVMRRVKKGYFLSFLTAVLYGFVLDGLMSLVALIPFTGIAARLIFFVLGLLVSAFGVSLLFHTYFPPEAYDLIVKDLAKKFDKPIGKIKTIYDLTSCVIAIALSLCFFGNFVGISWGTIVCAALNGFLIGRFGKLLEKHFTFKDALPFRDKL